MMSRNLIPSVIFIDTWKYPTSPSYLATYKIFIRENIFFNLEKNSYIFDVKAVFIVFKKLHPNRIISYVAKYDIFDIFDVAGH